MSRECPDCKIEMENGFIPEMFPTGAWHTSWHPGEAVQKLLGGIRFRRESLVPIKAYRCNGCGLVKLYANPIE